MKLMKKPLRSCWKNSVIASRSLSETVTPVQVKLFAEFWKHAGAPTVDSKYFQCFTRPFSCLEVPEKIDDFVYE